MTITESLSVPGTVPGPGGRAWSEGTNSAESFVPLGLAFWCKSQIKCFLLEKTLSANTILVLFGVDSLVI